MLGHPRLPPSLIERCLDVLKKIMPSERDLIRVIVEIIVELREGEDDAENADDPQVLVGSYCLDIIQKQKTYFASSSMTTNRTSRRPQSGRTNHHARPKNERK